MLAQFLLTSDRFFTGYRVTGSSLSLLFLLQFLLLFSLVVYVAVFVVVANTAAAAAAAAAAATAVVVDFHLLLRDGPVSDRALMTGISRNLVVAFI